MAASIQDSVAASAWRIESGRATLSADRLSVALQLDRPDLGLVDLRIKGQAAPGWHWLAVGRLDGPATYVLEDVYARGSDLIATYAESNEWPVRWQAYWRVLSREQLAGAIAGIDMIVSAQTSLLDSGPAMFAATTTGERDASRIAPDSDETPVFSVLRTSHVEMPSLPPALTLSVEGFGYTCLQAIHPQDDEGWDLDGELMRHRLFLRRLEKGVILRARLRSVWTPAGEFEVADDCFEAFHHAPPPLTV